MSNECVSLASARPRPHYGPRLKNFTSTENTTVAAEDYLHSSGWHFFNCSGTKNHLDVSRLSIISLESGNIVLFNQKFDKDSALVVYNKLLFQMARQCLMLLDSGPRSGSDTLQMNDTSMSRPSCESVPDANYLLKLRRQICEFLAYVCNYFERLMSADNDCTWIKGKLVSTISENMLFFQLLVEKLGQICNLSAVTGCLSSYHNLHAHLDIYCYHLDLLLCLDQSRKTDGNLEGPHVMNRVEKHVNLFIADLLLISIARFHQMSFSDMVSDSPFSCMCVKQVWVMLIRLLDTMYESDTQKKSFWMYVNSLLEKVKSESMSERTFSNELLVVPEHFVCKEPEMFKLWLVSHLGMLYKQEHLPIKDNLFQVESVMKQFVAPDSPISEIKLKTIILLITPLSSSVWASKPDVIMILWEYFHRRLNTMFLTQNASLDSLQIIKETSSSMLEEVKGRLDENFCQGDSWGLFLHLVGLYLKKSQQKHWHQVRGRIYSKFSPAKLQALTELGLYRLSSLFLTLCISIDMSETSVKLLDLLALMNPTDSLRRHVLWRAHLAVIILYMEHDADIKVISKPLRTELSSVTEIQNSVSSSLMRVLVVELQCLVEFDVFLKLSGHTLVDVWIQHYLLSCSETDACQLYGVLLSLILKVKGTWKDNFPMQASALAESLWQNTLPCILAPTNNTTSCESESVLGYHLTLLALHLPEPSRSFISIFCRFVNSQSISVKVLSKYLCLLIADPAAMNTLVRMANYQGLIVRAWLRCLILSEDCTSHSMSLLTRLVSELPEIIELASCQKMNLTEGSDTLVVFLKIVANSGSLFTDRVSFYLSQVETCLTRTNITSSRPTLAVRLYKCAAAFVQHASNIIYTKKPHSKTSNLLNAIMNYLLLPTSLFSANTKLNAPQQTAISETLHLFIQGLVQLKPRSDVYIFKCLKDLIVQYLPRLAQSQPNTMQNFLVAEPTSHPLLKCFDNLQSIEGEETGRLVLEVLSTTFIACKGKTRHSYTALALTILKEVLRKWTSSMEVVKLITECALGSVLEVVMFTEGNNIAHRKGIDILQTLLNQTGEIRSKQEHVVVGIAKEHLAFSAVYVFRLLEYLTRLDPQLVKSSLCRVRDLVAIVEQKRGVSFDRGLRSGIEKIDLLLLQ